jgi:hypothetical protein
MMDTPVNMHTTPYRNREVSDHITRAMRALNRAASIADAHGDPRGRSLHQHSGQLGLLLITPDEEGQAA